MSLKHTCVQDTNAVGTKTSSLILIICTVDSVNDMPCTSFPSFSPCSFGILKTIWQIFVNYDAYHYSRCTAFVLPNKCITFLRYSPTFFLQHYISIPSQVQHTLPPRYISILLMCTIFFFIAANTSLHYNVVLFTRL